jgi:hypothetical protein
MVGKAQNLHGARSGLYGGCTNGVPLIHFFHAEHRIRFRSQCLINASIRDLRPPLPVYLSMVDRVWYVILALELELYCLVNSFQIFG